MSTYKVDRKQFDTLADARDEALTQAGAAFRLSAAGYDDHEIACGLAYADRVGWRDENDRGALALARILYSDEQLADSPRAPWAK